MNDTNQRKHIMFLNIGYIDALIILAFLFIAVGIGMRAGASVKSFDDYIFYYKNLKPDLLGLSLTMVIFGSGTILGTFEEIKNVGIIYPLASFGYVINSIITAKFIVPKIDTRFNKCISVCDLFGIFYGKKAAFFSGIIAFIFDIGAASTQLIVIGKLISYSLNSSFSVSIIAASVVILIYSCAGGIRAVTILDVMKCGLLLIFIPILANFMTYNAGGILSVLSTAPEQSFSVLNNPSLYKYAILFFFFMMPTHMLQPIVVQRLLLIGDSGISSKAMYIYGLLRVALISMITLIGLAAIIKDPKIDFFFTISSSLPSILQGFTLATVLITIMCKADAHLNSSGIILIKTIMQPVFHNTNSLFAIRMGTFLIGLLATCIALASYSVINVIVFIESIWSVFIGIPLIMGIWRFKVNNLILKKYLILIVPIFSILCYEFSFATPLYSTITGFILMLGLLGYQSGELSTCFNKIMSYNPNIGKKYIALVFSKRSILDNILQYSNRKIEQVSVNTFAFSVFSCVNYTLPYFMGVFTQENIYPFIIIRIVCIALCIGLLIKNFWPLKLQKYFPFYWHLTLIITLPFATSFIFILEKWSVIALINSILAIFLLALLTDWISFIFFTLIGVLMAIVTFTYTIAQLEFSSDLSTNYLSVYSYAYSLLIALVFTRRKEASFDQKLEVARMISGVIAHEIRTNLLIIKNYSSAISEQIATIISNNELKNMPLSKADLGYLEFLNSNIDGTLKKSFSFIDTLLSNIKGPNMKDPPTKHSILECLEYAIKVYHANDVDKKRIKITSDYNFEFLGDREIIAHIFFNLLNNALFYASSRKNLRIDISTNYCELYNYLRFKDNGPGIAAHDITKVFDKFYSSNKKGTGLGLSFCKLAMYDLKGDITCKSVEGEFTEFILKFPKLQNDLSIY